MVRFEKLLEQLIYDYPQLKFRAGRRFCWRSPRTVEFEQFCDSLPNSEKLGGNSEHKKDSGGPEIEQNYYNLQLLHEVGHGLLGHRDFKTDVERVKMECAAWEKARELAEKYGVEYDEGFVEDELDTYRDWLHQRSKCPKCGLTRYQDRSGCYHCPQCETYGL